MNLPDLTPLAERRKSYIKWADNDAEPTDPLFGTEEGLPISNWQTILGEVDEALNREKPPDLIYIFVKPVIWDGDDAAQRAANYAFLWGHGCLAYKHEGKLIVANINNNLTTDRPFVDWLPLQDYLFGVSKDAFSKSEQYGIYNREFVLLCLHNVEADTLLNIHTDLLALRELNREGRVQFAMSPLHTAYSAFMRKYLFFLAPNTPKVQSCAGHISTVLHRHGLVRHTCEFPKKLFADMYLECLSAKREFDVVVVKNAPHATPHPVYRNEADNWRQVSASPTSGFLWLSFNMPFWVLDRLASAIIHVPPGTMNACCTQQEPARPIWKLPPIGYDAAHVVEWHLHSCFLSYMFMKKPTLFSATASAFMASLFAFLKCTRSHRSIFWKTLAFDAVVNLLTVVPISSGVMGLRILLAPAADLSIPVCAHISAGLWQTLFGRSL